jgi:hypothetical protein
LLDFGGFRGAVGSELTLFLALQLAGVVLAIIFISALENNLIHDYGGLVLDGHKSGMLFDNRSVYLLYFTGVAVVRTIDVVVGII